MQCNSEHTFCLDYSCLKNTYYIKTEFAHSYVCVQTQRHTHIHTDAR